MRCIYTFLQPSVLSTVLPSSILSLTYYFNPPSPDLTPDFQAIVYKTKASQ